MRMEAAGGSSGLELRPGVAARSCALELRPEVAVSRCGLELRPGLRSGVAAWSCGLINRSAGGW